MAMKRQVDSAALSNPDYDRDLDAARRVLRLESEGLTALAAALDDGFSRLLDILSATTGRITVTGMGKAGHVARKIAATLSSTGTPAQFVHPGEASHGDLGMITRDDIVLALSNSGDTAELDAVLSFCKRSAIPLVAITARENSTLAEMADHLLLLPRVPEACPMGLAPTSSTTAMLALGDALALVTSRMRDFRAEDFARFHPGGSLGRQPSQVADHMPRPGQFRLAGPRRGTQLQAKSRRLVHFQNECQLARTWEIGLLPDNNRLPTKWQGDL